MISRKKILLISTLCLYSLFLIVYPLHAQDEIDGFSDNFEDPETFKYWLTDNYDDLDFDNGFLSLKSEEATFVYTDVPTKKSYPPLFSCRFITYTDNFFVGLLAKDEQGLEYLFGYYFIDEDIDNIKMFLKKTLNNGRELKTVLNWRDLESLDKEDEWYNFGCNLNEIMYDLKDNPTFSELTNLYFWGNDFCLDDVLLSTQDTVDNITDPSLVTAPGAEDSNNNQNQDKDEDLSEAPTVVNDGVVLSTQSENSTETTNPEIPEGSKSILPSRSDNLLKALLQLPLGQRSPLPRNSTFNYIDANQVLPSDTPKDLRMKIREGLNGKNNLIIEWDEIPNAAGYKIFRKHRHDNNYKHIGTVDEPFFKDVTIKDNSTYSYAICSFNHFNENSGLVYKQRTITILEPANNKFTEITNDSIK